MATDTFLRNDYFYFMRLDRFRGLSALVFFLFAMSAVTGFAAVERVDSTGHQSVGLVLSGGGAKGIAHIGVIQALEDNDIPIDYIAGTSMGSIVGGLYAAGYTPAEMMELILSKGFSYWSTGQIDERLVYYFTKNEPTPTIVSLPVGGGDPHASKQKLPTSIISPLPMNFAFMELFAAYTAQCGGDFDKLYVPFRCVTSDVKNKHKIVCRNGHLSDAIRASMSFPVVFQPIRMDSVLVYDGGIYDNFPVDVMRSDFAPSIMIGVDVHGTSDAADADNLMNQLEDMIIQNNDYDLPADEGIKIRINLNEYSLLDFPKAEAIYQRGYDMAMSMMDSIKGRVTARVPAVTRELSRAVFKSATPYVRFDSVSVSGASPAQNKYIKYLFTKGRTDTFGISQARDGFYRAITPGRLRDLFPQAEYDAENGLFNLDVKASVKDNITVGVGGYITSSINSMVFLSGKYSSLSFNSFDVSLDGWIGQSYMAAQVNARLYLRTHVSSALTFQGVVSRHRFYESDKLFYQDNMPTFITGVEAFGRIKYGVAAGRSGKFDVSVGFGHLVDRSYRNDHVNYADVSRDRVVFNLGQARAAYDYNTLDDISYPTSGSRVCATAMWVYGSYDYRPGDLLSRAAQPVDHKANRGWLQGNVTAESYFPIGRHCSVGFTAEILASSRRLLDTYNASIVSAPAFTPTPSAYNSFNPAFRANSYGAVGVVPIWKISDNLQLRGNFNLFLPYRKIMESDDMLTPVYGKRFADPQCYCEVAGVYNFRFAALSVYCNYQSYPSRNWNGGVSFGLFFLAPRFLR